MLQKSRISRAGLGLVAHALSIADRASLSQGLGRFLRTDTAEGSQRFSSWLLLQRDCRTWDQGRGQSQIWIIAYAASFLIGLFGQLEVTFLRLLLVSFSRKLSLMFKCNGLLSAACLDSMFDYIFQSTMPWYTRISSYARGRKSSPDLTVVLPHSRLTR